MNNIKLMFGDRVIDRGDFLSHDMVGWDNDEGIVTRINYETREVCVSDAREWWVMEEGHMGNLRFE